MDKTKDSSSSSNLWHLLDLTDKPERGDCQQCRNSVLGIPTYKCFDCSFLIHKSCLEAQNITEMGAGHNLGETHHLISMNNDGEQVVCSMCEETVAHSPGTIVYKCFIGNCNFRIHQSCVELPFMTGDNSHAPDHILYLKPPDNSFLPCGACNELVNRSFFYKCDKCGYQIHSKCASSWKLKATECNPHAFTAIKKPMELTCEACGEKSRDLCCLCSKCGLLVHPKCAQFKSTIEVIGHKDPLTFTLSLSKDKCHLCAVCGEKVNTNYGAYCCEQCKFVAHLRCAYDTEGQGGFLTHLVEGIGPKEEEKDVHPKIQHDSHPEHDLLLNNEQPKGKRCAGCTQPIWLTPFYDCAECVFSLHTRCAQKLPEVVKRPISHWSHPLSLHNKPSDLKVSFRCYECERPRRGFNYGCDTCGIRPRDIQCILIPDRLSHPLHSPHILHLQGGWGRPPCNACGEESWGIRTFKCNRCEFRMCIRCGTLPLIARHKYDKDLLQLTDTIEDNPQENYCQICEKKFESKNWFYHCKKCDFSGHPKCVLEET